MNLVENPWIPCVDINGMPRQASILDCFVDERIADFSVQAHERVALMRLLLCVAYAAIGIPHNWDGWMESRGKLSDVAPEYLGKWKEHFWLFHPEHPFLQIPGLRNASKSGRTIPCSKLDFSLATGNNSTIWDHAALSERVFPPERISLNLLTFQMFSVGGLIGQVYWGESISGERHSCDAPCVSGSMLHTFLRRRTLLDTIHANMLSEEELHGYRSLGNDWRGRPIWEMFPGGIDDRPAIANATRTFLGRMVPLSRAILLFPNGKDMLLGDGLPYPSFSNAKNPFIPEVTATTIVKKDKKGKEYKEILKADSNQAIWRALPALTVKRRMDELGGCAALANAQDGDAVDLVVCGMARNQSEIVDVMQSMLHVPSSVLHTDGHAVCEHEIGVAERIAANLGMAVERYRRLADGGFDVRLKMAADRNGELFKMKSGAFLQYWTSVETGLCLLRNVMEEYGGEGFKAARNAWRFHLASNARAAYAAACGNDTERQMRAYVSGRRFLAGMLRKHLEREGGE